MPGVVQQSDPLLMITNFGGFSQQKMAVSLPSRMSRSRSERSASDETTDDEMFIHPLGHSRERMIPEEEDVTAAPVCKTVSEGSDVVFSVNTSGGSSSSASVNKRSEPLVINTSPPVSPPIPILHQRLSESAVGRKKKMTSVGSFDDVPSARPFRYFSSDEVGAHSPRTNGCGKLKMVFSQPIVNRWRHVAKKALSLEDPWEEQKIENYPAEECTRYRYSSLRKQWVKDTVLVKVQPESFGRGAMRECFRLKKLATNGHDNEWSRALNYVAKRYIAEVDRETYFEDVRLQMDAKLWGDEFNRHNPPKKIDVFQMSILEFGGRPDKPLFHLEHFIEGHYIKYNSNSGFVDADSTLRQTPQAFSHFSFERSGHQLIVVDIQGVGDLYTDPQIHTVDGKGYGDGNLGTRGMALFFHSHICNTICKGMGLTQFDLSPSELAGMKKFMARNRCTSETVCRGSEELCLSPGGFRGLENAMDFIRTRSSTSTSISNSMDSLSSAGGIPCSVSNGVEFPMELGASNDNIEAPPDELNSGDQEEVAAHISRRTRSIDGGIGADGDTESKLSSAASTHSRSGLGHTTTRRARFSSDVDSVSSSVDQEREAFWAEHRKHSRPSCYSMELEMRQLEHLKEIKSGGSILGQIHLDIARYHELGRFSVTQESPYDRAAAWFHLEVAANCGILEAVVNMAKIYLRLEHDLLQDFEMEDDDENIDHGLDLMELAADSGDRMAMLHLAHAYDTGTGLGSERERSWANAVKYYEMAASMDDEDEGGEFDATLNDPKYSLLARLGEMHRDGQFGLSKNCYTSSDYFTKAAEAAMEGMKGKLASKFYSLAEQVMCEAEE